jgi:Fe-S-cluster containining protein
MKKQLSHLKETYIKSLLAAVMVYLTKSKMGRFTNSYINKQPDRQGSCTPELCETLDGQKGSACCKLGYRCPALCDSDCGIYEMRPRNCRVFPSNPEDLKLVKNCGYYWK